MHNLLIKFTFNQEMSKFEILRKSDNGRTPA